MTNYTNGESNGNAAPLPHPSPAPEAYHFNTRVIHAGSEANEETGAVIPPISLATTYKQSAVGVHKVSALSHGCVGPLAG